MIKCSCSFGGEATYVDENGRLMCDDCFSAFSIGREQAKIRPAVCEQLQACPSDCMFCQGKRASDIIYLADPQLVCSSCISAFMHGQRATRDAEVIERFQARLQPANRDGYCQWEITAVYDSEGRIFSITPQPINEGLE